MAVLTIVRLCCPGGAVEGGRGDNSREGEYGGVGILPGGLHQLSGGGRAQPL